jgi:hypothetical protein
MGAQTKKKRIAVGSCDEKMKKREIIVCCAMEDTGCRMLRNAERKPLARGI